MSMNLEQFFPAARPWVENLVNVWPTPYVKPNFAFWEVGHVLSLIALGGATILMNLRLIGVGLIQEPPSEIFRNLRVVQTAGVVGIVLTGVLIGMANAERLYDSAAFIVKMLGLIGGVILTYGVSRTTVAAEGRVSTAAKAWFVLGMAFWLAALVVFATGGLIAPGIWHVVTAAALLVLFATRGRARIVYAGVLAALVLAQELAPLIYHAVDPADLDPINVSFAVIIPAWIVGTALVQFFRAGQGEEGGPLTKIIGCATILVWLTSAAAGRWIAFA
jgi:uncharacterized protein DUF6644